MFSLNKITLIDTLEGLKKLPDNSINTIITSPPYNKGKLKRSNQMWNVQIDYDTFSDDMPEEIYQKWQVEFLNECFRVLKDDGSMFYNHKPRRINGECLLPEEWLVHSKFNLHQKIIWDRKASPNVAKHFLIPTTETFYWLTKNKNPKVFKNNLPKQFQTSIWELSAIRNKEHPAPFHPLLPQLCIQLTTEEGDVVLDPFNGVGNTAIQAKKFNRKYVGFDISEQYINLTNNYLNSNLDLFNNNKFINNDFIKVNNKTNIQNNNFNHEIKMKELLNIEKSSLRGIIIFIESNKDFDNFIDKLNIINDKLDKKGSLFIINKGINQYYDINDSIINSKLKLYQNFFVNNNSFTEREDKLDNVHYNVYWCCNEKETPIKYRDNLRHEHRKEVWNLKEQNITMLEVKNLIYKELKKFLIDNDNKNVKTLSLS